MDRKSILETIKEENSFDIVVIGGGITGAGIARRAALSGFKTLLVEKRDFSWGTSSRSGKLVHGGLRYIKQGQLKITYHSVKEREKLLKIYRKLILPLRFVMPLEKKSVLSKILYGSGLFLYDLFARRRVSSFVSYEKIKEFFPALKKIHGVYSFYDAKTDDSDLTFQIIRESVALGAIVANYVEAIHVEGVKGTPYKGVVLRDSETGMVFETEAKFVVSATGAWTDCFDSSISLRKLKGSHLIFPRDRLPVEFACALFHPIDKRPLYILPWEGVTLFGTTDVDYKDDLSLEPKISESEVVYLLEALNYWFINLNLGRNDTISVFSGVRGVVNTGKKDPSKENRDYILKVKDNGVMVVAGGKLTTFDYMARKVVDIASKFIRGPSKVRLRRIILPNDFIERLESIVFKYEELLDDNKLTQMELEQLVEIGYIVHLEDLLLRRSRIGLTKIDGGLSSLCKIEPIIKRKLKWDERRWMNEVKSYENLISKYYRMRGKD